MGPPRQQNACTPQPDCSEALFNIETSVFIQKRHPYKNLNSEMPEDSKNAFLHFGDV